MILLIILNILYAWMFIISKFALSTGTPVFMTAVRMMIGGIVTLIIYNYRSSLVTTIKNISRYNWFLIGLLSLTNIYLCNALEYWGLQYLSAGKTAFIYNLGPFFAALLAYFLFSEKMTFYKWFGLLLGFIGFLPIIAEPSQALDTTIQFGFISLADIGILVSAVTTVIGWTIMRYLIKKSDLSSLFLNGLSMIFGSLFCFLHAYLFESMPYIIPGLSLQFLGYALSMALSQNVIAYNLHGFLLKKYTTTLITFSMFISSLLAAILGVFILNETISPYFIVGVILVLVGLIIFYQEELRQGYIQK